MEIEYDEDIKLGKNELFVGRENVFNEIDDYLKKSKLVFLYGIPGVGKTSCATEYIYKKVFVDRYFKHFFIFDAEETYKIQQGIYKYCKQLNISKDSDENDIKIFKFFQYCKETEDLVFLFDNLTNFSC